MAFFRSRPRTSVRKLYLFFLARPLTNTCRQKMPNREKSVCADDHVGYARKIVSVAIQQEKFLRNSPVDISAGAVAVCHGDVMTGAGSLRAIEVLGPSSWCS